MDFEIVRGWFDDYDAKDIVSELNKMDVYSEHNWNIALIAIDRAENIAWKEKVSFNSKDSREELSKVNKTDEDFCKLIADISREVNYLDKIIKKQLQKRKKKNR